MLFYPGRDGVGGRGPGGKESPDVGVFFLVSLSRTERLN